MNQNNYERLYSAVTDAEQTIKDVAFRLSDLAEDLAMLREELEGLTDQERYYHNG